MDNPNNGPFRPPPNPSPPYASTPRNVRTQRPRFAYSGPPNFPRPGSSASKPNPDLSFTDIMRSRYVPFDNCNDSMMNNCGDSMNYMDTSLPSPGNSFASDYSSSSFQSQDSIYYSCNESFSSSPRKPFQAFGSYGSGGPPEHPSNTGLMEPGASQPRAPLLNQPTRFKAPSSVVNPNKRKPFYAQGRSNFKKSNADSGPKQVWRCTLCEIVFTSSIPYNMHLSGSKHAKKLKAHEVQKKVELQVSNTKDKDVVVIGNEFRCELCGIIANSSNQLQMHLDGVKHKSKLLHNNPEATTGGVEEKTDTEAKDAEAKETDVNGTKKKETTLTVSKDGAAAESKTDSAPAEKNATAAPPQSLDVPKKPFTKSAFHCSTCELYLNSEFQLQQHLTGKYHKAKVEGTTLPFHAKKKAFLRKVTDAKNLKSNAVNNVKVTEAMETCESNQAEGITVSSENVQPKAASEVQQETKEELSEKS